jgi:hypothetical protein
MAAATFKIKMEMAFRGLARRPVAVWELRG